MRTRPLLLASSLSATAWIGCNAIIGIDPAEVDPHVATVSASISSSVAASSSSAAWPADCDVFMSCTDSTCVGCAFAGPCAAEYLACKDDNGCHVLVKCLNTCSGDSVCAQTCHDAYPSGEALWQAMTRCLVCDTCAQSCPGGCDLLDAGVDASSD